MLKNISKLITPELLKILAEMGHGDTIVIADSNFPAANCGKRVVYNMGCDAVQMLEAVLDLLPLDQYVDSPVTLMELNKGDTYVPAIWDEFKRVIKEKDDKKIEFCDRFKFYEESKNAFAVISTGEERLYGCIILRKGVIK